MYRKVTTVTCLGRVIAQFVQGKLAASGFSRTFLLVASITTLHNQSCAVHFDFPQLLTSLLDSVSLCFF